MTDLNEAVAAPGTQDAIDAAQAKFVEGTLHVFDTAAEGFITVNGEAVTADWAPEDEGYNAETDKVVYDNYFHESEFRSAPYFSIRIDGIELLNEKY